MPRESVHRLELETEPEPTLRKGSLIDYGIKESPSSAPISLLAPFSVLTSGWKRQLAFPSFRCGDASKAPFRTEAAVAAERPAGLAERCAGHRPVWVCLCGSLSPFSASLPASLFSLLLAAGKSEACAPRGAPPCPHLRYGHPVVPLNLLPSSGNEESWEAAAPSEGHLLLAAHPEGWLRPLAKGDAPG